MIPQVLIDGAKNKNIAPEKYKELVAHYERTRDLKAEAAFNAAFLKMQPQLPVIDERGKIVFSNGTHGTYALNEDIQVAVAPILNRFGFYLDFQTHTTSSGMVCVIGALRHRRGSQRTSTFEANPITGDLGMSHAQGVAAVITMGHRYTTVDLLNIVSKGPEQELRGFMVPPNTPVPAGFAALAEAALGGTHALELAWSDLPASQRAGLPQPIFVALKGLAETRNT